LLVTSRLDFCLDADLFLERGLVVSWEFETGRVDGSLDSGLFAVGWLEAARWVDSSAYSNLFTI
jgi:hypothetical protein